MRKTLSEVQNGLNWAKKNWGTKMGYPCWWMLSWTPFFEHFLKTRPKWLTRSDSFSLHEWILRYKHLPGWWFGTWLLFSISYMGFFLPIDELIFFKVVKTTNQLFLFIFYFSINWECHHPKWLSLHHFSEGLKPPTSKKTMT